MNVIQLRHNWRKTLEHLKEQAGRPVVSAEDGPIGTHTIEEIIQTLEAMDRQLKKLERNQPPMRG